MFVEIKRENGLLFSVDTTDIKEVGEHETGGTYVIFADGSSMLLEQDYRKVKVFLRACDSCFAFDFSGLTLMSKQKYKQLKARVKRVKRVKGVKA